MAKISENGGRLRRLRRRLVKKLYLAAHAVLARGAGPLERFPRGRWVLVRAVDLLERIPCRDLGHEPVDPAALVSRCLRCSALLDQEVTRG